MTFRHFIGFVVQPATFDDRGASMNSAPCAPGASLRSGNFDLAIRGVFLVGKCGDVLVVYKYIYICVCLCVYVIMCVCVM